MLSYMTTELALLAASVVLSIVHIIIVSHLQSWQRGYWWTASSREQSVAPLTGIAGIPFCEPRGALCPRGGGHARAPGRGPCGWRPSWPRSTALANYLDVFDVGSIAEDGEPPNDPSNLKDRLMARDIRRRLVEAS